MRQVLALNRRYWPLATAGILTIVTVMSLLPVERLPLAEVLIFDKLDHSVAYAAVALPVAVARPRRWWLVVTALLVWSAGIEVVQPAFGRYREALDLAANGVGFLLAIVVSEAARRMLPRDAPASRD